MLAISRRNGEEVVIYLPDGRTLSVFVNNADRGTTKLAFDAPADVKIFRREVVDRPGFVTPTGGN